MILLFHYSHSAFLKKLIKSLVNQTKIDTYLFTGGRLYKNSNLNMSDLASMKRNKIVIAEQSGKAEANRVTYPN